MKRRSLARPIAAALVLSFCFASCESVTRHFGKKKDGLEQVDALLSRVEQVQVEAVLSKKRAVLALEQLQIVTAPEFQVDALDAYSQLSEAISQSQQQAKKLGDSVGPMKKAAESFFDQWMADLDNFASPEMRRRSQVRMADTRARYDAIVVAVEPAHASLEAFNSMLKDHLIFLGHDFNIGSITDLSTDVARLSVRGAELQQQLDRCVDASQQYVAVTALRGQIDDPSQAGTQTAQGEPDAQPVQKAVQQPAVQPAQPIQPARPATKTGSSGGL